MSFGAGHVIDMVNRMRQNRSLRPSNKAKFKENERKAVYEGTGKAEFNKVSPGKLARIKEAIRKSAEADKRRDKVLFLVSVILTILLFLIFFYVFRT